MMQQQHHWRQQQQQPSCCAHHTHFLPGISDKSLFLVCLLWWIQLDEVVNAQDGECCFSSKLTGWQQQQQQE